MKNILVPTDFSKGANNATVYALELAKRIGATIHLLHIVYPTEGVDNNTYHVIWYDDFLEIRRKSLGALAQELSEKPGFSDVVIRPTIQIGYPASGTVAFANEIQADLIVMGATGNTGLAGAILGSTTQNLLSRSNFPTLIVPISASYKDANPITLATDYLMAISPKTMKVLQDFIRMHHTKLKVVHILNQPGEQVDKHLETSLNTQLKGIHHEFHYIHDENILQAVNDYLEATESSVLVTVAHKHNFWYKLLFESVSQTLAHQSRIPTLVLFDNK